MNTARPWWRAGLLAALLTGCGVVAPPAPALAQPRPAPSVARPYVILVSLDAFRHDYIERYHPPVLEALASRGIRAAAMVPAFPSLTFPNHYTIATGLYPGHHGIVANNFYDPALHATYVSKDSTARDGRWYRGEPIWVTAEKNGVHSGVYFWPGSEAAIGGVRPGVYRKFDARVPSNQRVDESVGWLRRPAATRPHLVLLYLGEVDEATHDHGPDAPNTATAVANVDRALGRLLDSIAVLPIRDSVNVVVVSDHGMTTTSPERLLNVFDALRRAGIDTAGILASGNGPTMSLWFNSDRGRIARARAALSANLAHADVYANDSIPARFHLAGNPRAGDLLLVAWAGNILQQHAADKAPKPGAHGFDPAWDDMHGIFVAAGPNVRKAGVIPAFESVNVYPFIAALLRLERVPAVDGRREVLGRYVR